MSKIYYFEDKNGEYTSADGSRRFTKLEGNAAYEYLRSPMGKGRRFMKLVDRDSDDDFKCVIHIEVPRNGIKAFRKYERHEQYIADVVKACDYEVLSLDYAETDDGETLIETVADESVDVEKEAFHQINLAILRKALNLLTEDEYALINALYLQENTMTLQAYAKSLGVSYTTIDSRKKRILRKLKNYFDF